MPGIDTRFGQAAAFHEDAEIVRNVFEHSNDAIFVIDPGQDRVLDANPKACALLGYAHDELLATPISAIHPQEMPELIAFAQSVFNEGAGWTDRLTCLTKTGARIPAEFSASAITIDGQRCLIVLVRAVAHRRGDQILRDIFAETAAATGEDFFRSLVRHLAAALGVRYALIAARAPQPNQGQILALWSDRGPSGNFAHDLAATPCAAVLAGQIVHHPRDLRSLFPLGNRELYPHAVSYLGFPLRDSQGQVLGHLAVMDDKPMPAVPLEMSVFRIFAERARAELERGRMEAILRQSEERFRTLARLSPSLIFRADAAGIMLYVNERWNEWTGRPNEEALGSGWARAVHPEDREYALAAWRQSIARRGPLSIQFRLLRADGSVGWVTGQAEPELDENGEALSYVGACTDISTQKDTERQLLTAKQSAEAADRAKTDFLAHLSHELRTPLNGILGYARLLEPAANLSDGQRDALAVIQQSGEHLLSLINDLLDLSKIEARRLEPAANEFHLPEFLRFIVETLRVRAAGKGLVLAYEPVTPLPIGVRGDEQRLRQILVNLLGNAVKFTDRGSVHFRVGRHGKRMWFEIIDTGIGIPADQLDKIFLPFQQVAHQTRVFEGAGLGLAICRRLVEALDGSLTVDSALGEGSRFRLELTLPEAPAFKDSATGRRPEITGYRGPRIKILVVDDRRDNRRLLRQILEPLGFAITEAADGLEALDGLQRDRPQVVLMDLVMPVLDGFEATRRLRRLPEPRDLVVIGISASVRERSQQDSLAAGCDDFLAKPVRSDELLQCLQKHLHLQWLHEDQASSTTTEAAPSQAVEEPENPPSAPSRAELDVLRDLVAIGDIQGILEAADRIGRGDERLLPFARRLREFAKAFEINKIREFLGT